MLLTCRWGVAVACGLGCASCSPGYDVTLSPDSAVSAGPSGVTIPIHVKSSDTPGGVALAMSAVPSSISVTPAAVTISSGEATAYALVPYGTAGTVVASAAFATTASADVAAGPLVLCPSAPVAADGGIDLADGGKVFTESVAVKRDGTCATGTRAPSGVPVAFAVSQNGASAVSSTAQTDATGVTATNVLVPWSTEVFVQATAGGGSTSIVISGAPNPATIACMSWVQSPPNVYKIVAKVTDGTSPIASMKTSFSITSSAATVGAPAPASSETSAQGIATTYVSLATGASLPVVVEAASGNSASTIVLTADPSSGSCP